SALEQKQQVDIIASPRLLGAAMQPASLKQGSENIYEVSTGETGANTGEFKKAVLWMDVNPVVLTGGRLRLKIHNTEKIPGQLLHESIINNITFPRKHVCFNIGCRPINKKRGGGG
ncbi:hypothetical protein ACVGWG_02085, partial [Enterobacter asburiae]